MYPSRYWNYSVKSLCTTIFTTLAWPKASWKASQVTAIYIILLVVETIIEQRNDSKKCHFLWLLISSYVAFHHHTSTSCCVAGASSITILTLHTTSSSWRISPFRFDRPKNSNIFLLFGKEFSTTEPRRTLVSALDATFCYNKNYEEAASLFAIM
jgi:hypothetical protein